MNDVLLTVSGVIDPDLEAMVARGERPRPDYLAMAEAFGADLLDYAAARRATGRLGRWMELFGGPNLTLAWEAFKCRKRYRVIFTDGEQVGIPLALLLKLAGSGPRPCHLMIAHQLSTRAKRLCFERLRVQRQIDTVFVYTRWQQRFAESRLKIAPERIVLTPFMVDAEFFRPSRVQPTPALAAPNGHGRPVICAVGLERRDYPTLMAAVAGLDVQVVVAAASPWSKRASTAANQVVPENVRLGSFSWFELRQLYARSRFVVVPLFDVPFQAGITTILEAMAMERAVVCSRTAGQTDAVVDGETGVYVPPHDPAALRAAIASLLDDPSRAERMGKTARLHVEQNMALNLYAARLGHVVRQAASSR